jgi:rhodanese-related sulfurtransferase
VRTPAEWDGGRIKWAEHFPLSDILEDHFPQAEKGEALVLQCGSGYRSNIAASIMKQAGYPNVKSLAGGIFAWSNAGLPVVSNYATNRTRSWKDQKGKDYRMQSLPFPLGENRRIARVSCKPYEEYANSFTA